MAQHQPEPGRVRRHCGGADRHAEQSGLLQLLLQRQGALVVTHQQRDDRALPGWPRPAGQGPIVPLLVGDNQRALALQKQLEQAGLLSVAIRPPTVPTDTARLRLVLRHDLPPGSLELLISALGSP